MWRRNEGRERWRWKILIGVTMGEVMVGEVMEEGVGEVTVGEAAAVAW